MPSISKAIGPKAETEEATLPYGHHDEDRLRRIGMVFVR
jgi:hypothetical protein